MIATAATKNIDIVCFSPTGSTRRIAHAIAAGTGLPVREIDLTSPASREGMQAPAHHFAPDALVIIAMPVYGGRLPRISEAFFSRLQADGCATALVVVYGNRHYDDALLELKNCSTQKGLVPLAAGAFVAEHTYTGKAGTGRPDASDAPVLAAFGRRFLEKALAWQTQNRPAKTPAAFFVPGKFPYEKPVANSQIIPVTNDECVNCQTCVEGCPAGAIDKNDPRNINHEKCLSCCYCIKVCPKSARCMDDPRLLVVINRLETQFTARREAELFF